MTFRWRVVIALTLLAAGTMPARAHDGWMNWGGYKSPVDGTHCCGKNDCFIVPAEQVKVTPGGYLLNNGETVPYMETLPSEDQEYWRCKRQDGSRRCFFAPQPGS